MTAARITNGNAIAGNATTNARPISRAEASGDVRQVLTAVTAPHHHAKDRADHKARQQAAGEQREAIDTPVTDPTVIRTRLGGIVSVWAPVADNSATSSPGFEPLAFISGNSAGAIAAMSAALEPEMPDTRYIAPIST